MTPATKAGFLLLTALLAASPSWAADKPQADKLSVEQLAAQLSATPGRSDSELASMLGNIQLTERLSSESEAKLLTTLPGEKSQTALMMVADKAALLDPPEGELIANPTPDAAATRQMLVKIVHYVNTTNRQLPNLIAQRQTNSFADSPQQDALEATGIVSYAYRPLHWVGSQTVTVTYRDRNEVVDEKAGKRKTGDGIAGFETSGEFGPILSVVVGNALKGKITWGHWERGAAGVLAVFKYSVPENESSYRVQFCCVVADYTANGTAELEPYDEKAAYHGEITFDPADGAILRLTAITDMPSGGLVSQADFAVQYAPVEIGGRSYICPVHGIAELKAHTTKQEAAQSRSSYVGSVKTYLNDVVFSGYHRFGAESRMLPASDSER